MKERRILLFVNQTIFIIRIEKRILDLANDINLEQWFSQIIGYITTSKGNTYYLYEKTRYTISCLNKKIKKRELLDNISGFCPYCHRQIYIIDFI